MLKFKGFEDDLSFDTFAGMNFVAGYHEDLAHDLTKFDNIQEVIDFFKNSEENYEEYEDLFFGPLLIPFTGKLKNKTWLCINYYKNNEIIDSMAVTDSLNPEIDYAEEEDFEFTFTMSENCKSY